VFLFACLFVARANAQEGGFPPAQVEVVPAELRNMAPVVEVAGTVVSLNDSRIAAEVEGVLTWLADVGDELAAGDVIARIDPRLMQVALDRASAEVARLESEYEFRDRQLRRTEELATQSVASETLLDETRALRDQAMHQLSDAHAALARAKGDRSRASIRAPFAGHVTERIASVGEYVTPGEDIVRFVDTQRLEIALPAPIALTQFVKPGATVSVSGGGVQRDHKVRAVVPVGDVVSRMVEVRLDGQDTDWLVGTPVQVSLPSDHPVTTVAVPRDALVERGNQRFIYVVSEDGTAQQVVADVRTIIGLWVGVNGGIAEGDRVIVRGAERIMPGQPVSVADGKSQ
jgi:RND family efflux transporter MFP subunit